MTLQSQNLTEASKVENYRFYDLYVEFLDLDPVFAKLKLFGVIFRLLNKSSSKSRINNTNFIPEIFWTKSKISKHRQRHHINYYPISKEQQFCLWIGLINMFKRNKKGIFFTFHEVLFWWYIYCLF